MFGYVKPNIPELKIKEHEIYKATYCGLCKTMGKCTGCFSKMTLSYDFAFLALLRIVADDAKCQIKSGRCLSNPFKKRPIMQINDSLKYSARTSVILTRLKLKDNIRDSRGFARLGARIAACVSIFLKKTDKDLKELEAKIQDCIDELTILEEQSSSSIDETAQTFGKLLGACASHSYKGTVERIMYEIGFHLGKWIYVIDAIDDLAKDVKKKTFNPIKNAIGTELDENSKAMLYSATMLELNMLSKSVELLDFSHHRDIEPIIKNVVYDGLVSETTRVLALENKSRS